MLNLDLESFVIQTYYAIIYYYNYLFLGASALAELSERFGKNKVHFIKCNVLEKDDIVNLYEVIKMTKEYLLKQYYFAEQNYLC